MSVWHELVIEGAEGACRAFVAGFAAGRRAAPPVFGRDCGLAHESSSERLRALFAGGSHHVVFAPKMLAGLLVAALAERGAAVGLRLEQRRRVDAMHFGFRVEAFARPLADGIRRDLLLDVPRGVRIEGLSESAEENPEARGTDLYSPVHAYIYRASGRFRGRPPEIFDVRRRAAARDFVTADGLHAETTAL